MQLDLSIRRATDQVRVMTLARAALSSCDTNEIAAFASRAIGCETVVVPRDGAVDCCMAWAAPSEDLAVLRMASGTGLAFELRGGGSPRLALWLSVAGSMRLRLGEAHLAGRSGRLLLASVDAGAAFELCAGHDGIVILLSQRTVFRRLGASAGAGPSGAMVGLLATIDGEAALGTALAGYGILLGRAVGGTTSLLKTESAVLEQVGAFTALLLAALPDAPAMDLRPPASPSLREVERAEAFMREHAKRPIGIKDVAKAVGVSVRTLQSAFKRHRAVTPLATLQRYRLEGVRADLKARRDVRISSLALDWGFSHLGRFAADYRAAFGELPSQTQMRDHQQ